MKKLEKGNYLAYLKEKAEDNKANKELINLVSGYFKISFSQIKIKTGKRSREKIIEIEKNEN